MNHITGKTYKLTRSGLTVVILPLTMAVTRAAGAGLKREGVKINSDKVSLEDNVDFTLELARRCVGSLTTADGASPMTGLSPRDARTLISEIPGLVDMVLVKGKEQNDDEAVCEAVESGN